MRSLRPGAVVKTTGVRGMFGETILGTGTISGAFAVELQRDLASMGQKVDRFESIKDCVIKKGELDHMESPEDDIRQMQKIDRLADDFFSRIPLPEDPMAAALAPTHDEVVQNERFEILRESVRERYQAAQSVRRIEDSRIKEAMGRVADGTWKRVSMAQSEEDEIVAAAPRVDLEKQRMQLEIEALRKRLAELESASK